MEWESQDFVMTFRGGYYPIGGGYTHLGAKSEFWSDSQANILKEVRELTDQGWEPVTEIGPGGIKLQDAIQFNWKAYLVLGILTLGFGLLAPFFFFEKGVRPYEFRVTMRRRK